jgi:hypothetical protein
MNYLDPWNPFGPFWVGRHHNRTVRDIIISPSPGRETLIFAVLLVFLVTLASVIGLMRILGPRAEKKKASK